MKKSQFPRGVSIFSADHHGKQEWRVRLRKSFTGGKMVYRWFKTRREGVEWIAEQAQKRDVHGKSAYELTSDQIAAARTAFLKLPIPSPKALVDAVDYYVAHLNIKDRMDNRTIRDIFNNFTTTKTNLKLSPDYLKSIEYCTGAFVKEFGGATLPDLKTEMIKDWLARFDNPTTYNNYLRNVSVFLNFALGKKARDLNPCLEIEEIKVPEKHIEFLKVDEARRLMNCAKNHSDILAFFALALFAGIRPGEIKRMRWTNHVLFETQIINLDGKVTKLALCRRFQMKPNLLEWLKLCPQANDKIVYGKNFKDRRERVIIEAGWNIKEMAKKGRKVLNIINPFPKNGLRHSFGTYACLLDGEIDTASEMGNSPAMIKRHYRGIATKQDAEALFNIYP